MTEIAQDNNYKLAGIIRRLCAEVLLDGLIYLLILSLTALGSYFLIKVVSSRYASLNSENGMFLCIIIALCLGIILCYLYNVLSISSSRQATIGMRILKIKAVDKEGNRISYLRSMFRAFIYGAISVAMFPLSFFFAIILIYGFAAFNKNKMTMHDYIARTYVVHSN